MNLHEEIEKARNDQSAIVLKDYFKIDISWDRILNFLYEQSLHPTKIISFEAHQERENAIKNGAIIFGDIHMYPPLWIKSQSGKMWDMLPELKDFIEKLNEDTKFKERPKQCTCHLTNFNVAKRCNSTWHLSGMIVSLASKRISEHKDVDDFAYLQIVGKSFWRMVGKEETEFTLNPGDVILGPKEISHEVWGEGPRSGLLLMSPWK